MKFNLKLFVLVGILAGFRDVCGTEKENKDDDVFIVAEFAENKELNEAINEKRVIKAVYTTRLGGAVDIIHKNFGKNLSKVFVRAGNGENEVKEVDNFTANSAGRLVHNMQEKVEYTVYFIFNNESFNSKSEGLLVSTALMFNWCILLIHADLSNFNTKNVTDMHEMFGYCSSLKKLNLSPSNTTSVEDMSYMFNGCTALTELDLSKFDTQNVTNMSGMFYYCTALTKLDFSKLNTKKVENMSYMFYKCSSLTEVNISSFNTKNVTNMDCIFYECSSLTTLDLSKFNTENVTNMYAMFKGCTSLNPVFLPVKGTEKKKKCICCGDEYVCWNNREVEELNPKIVQFKDPKEIIGKIST